MKPAAIKEDFPVVQFNTGGVEVKLWEETKAVVGEISLKIMINGVDYASLLCINQFQKEMALGFLYNEGVINDPADIKNIDFNEGHFTVAVELNERLKLNVGDSFRSVTSGCGKCYTYIKPTYRDLYAANTSASRYELKRITDLMKEFNREPPIFNAFGGVHAAKYVGDDLGVLVEDIGRHNCIDKIAGILLLKGGKMSGGLMLVSGRISSEIVTKIVRMGVPVIASRSTPTIPALKLAEQYGITLLGYVREGRGVIYTGKERIEEVVRMSDPNKN